MEFHMRFREKKEEERRGYRQQSKKITTFVLSSNSLINFSLTLKQIEFTSLKTLFMYNNNKSRPLD